MIRFLKASAISLAAMVALTACGGSGGGTTEPPPSLLEVLADVNLSAVEATSGAFSADDYIANAALFYLCDIDDDNTTVLSTDGKRFTSADLNVTISDHNITYVAGNVDFTTSYAFGLVGLDSYGRSLELNATFQITDELDDAATLLGNIAVPSAVSLFDSNFTVTATATDPDGMLEVVVLLSKDGTLLDTRTAVPEGNLSRVDVNETFANAGEGNYTVTFTALGLISGEGNNSFATASRTIEISLANDLAALFSELNTTLNDLNSTLTSLELESLLGDLNTTLNNYASTLGDLNSSIGEANVTTLLVELNTTIFDSGLPLTAEEIGTVIDELNATLTENAGSLLDILPTLGL